MDSVKFTSSMLPFFSLRPSTKRERIAMLKKAFHFVAGEQLEDFINHFLTSTEFGKSSFLPIINNNKMDKYLESLKELMLNSPSKHLPALRSLITSSYSLKELLDLGFSMTKNEYTYSKKIKNKKQATLNKKNKNNENLSVKKENIKTIIKNILKNSFPTSQYTKKSPGKIYEEVEKEITDYSTKIKFSLTKSKKEIYENMIQNDEISISISTFYKLIPGNIIKSKKQTDMCNICNIKKSLEKTQNELIAKDQIVPDTIKKDLKAISQHEIFYKHQNKQYNNDINKLDHKSCVIVMDFKENFKIGGGPIETNNCFYEKKPISLLGFAVVYKENEKIKYEYHNFLSEILSHDSLFSGQCLIELLKKDQFRRIRNLKIWTDNGNHFRSYEFLYYLFKEVPSFINGSIKFNRFVECHGKSIVDGNFGVLSKLFRQKENEIYINTILDLKNVFEKEEERKCIYSSLVNNSVISQKSFFYIYERVSRPKKRYIEIKGLHINLSYLMKAGNLYASPLTFDDFSEYSEISYKIKSSDDIRETKRSESFNSAVGQVHEVGRITRGYISNRVISLTKTTTFFSNIN